MCLDFLRAYIRLQGAFLMCPSACSVIPFGVVVGSAVSQVQFRLRWAGVRPSQEEVGASSEEGAGAEEDNEMEVPACAIAESHAELVALLTEMTPLLLGKPI